MELNEIFNELPKAVNLSLHKENEKLRIAVIEANRRPQEALGFSSVNTSLGMVTCYSDTGNLKLQEEIDKFIEHLKQKY